jgi:hypothetical protein
MSGFKNVSVDMTVQKVENVSHAESCQNEIAPMTIK